MAIPRKQVSRWAWIYCEYVAQPEEIKEIITAHFSARNSDLVDETQLLINVMTELGIKLVGEDPDPPIPPTQAGAEEYEDAMAGLELLGK